MSPDARGLGIGVTDDGRAIGAHGEASERLFVIGPLRKGGLWETTAVPELRAQAGASCELLQP